MLSELEDMTRSDLYIKSPEERSIWLRMQGVAGRGAQLDASLAFASTLPLALLRILVEELRRGDITAHGPAELFMRLCPAPRSGLIPRSSSNDIRLAHRTLIYERAKARVKEVLGVTREQSLATQVADSYGLGPVFALVDIATSLGAIQLHHLLRLHPPHAGYGYMDDVAAAMNSCVCMTTPLASSILHGMPSVDQLVMMVHNGNLAEWGLIPADLNEDELRQHISKLHATYSTRELPAGLAPGRH